LSTSQICPQGFKSPTALDNTSGADQTNGDYQLDARSIHIAIRPANSLFREQSNEQCRDQPGDRYRKRQSATDHCSNDYRKHDGNEECDI